MCVGCYQELVSVPTFIFPPLKQTVQGQGGLWERWFSFWEIQTACWYTALGVWIPLKYPPYWKVLFWIIATKKLHKLYCIFIRQIYSCIGGELGVSVEWNELLSVPRSTARRASGAATLYWGGKSETHPGICSAASCWVLTRWAVENQTPSIGISFSFTKLWYAKR